ncbi:D-alanine--D-alanine ligase [Flagellimonas halotolerans]|uniref:D-alanine--D-alanine ligase n=1 Tax=Flagellimonas halotolerans TaxID=3112164 RepID=A0ABU6IQC9_9FLAO|nr:MULTISPECIES: D-alanine--D-alanine ligase [unclassified Allomuricauda]MEC3965417.1 D-alanine--D-alanine ligase [Muricauda sp. SYSU M86414]MEC4265283.1 D-alanine--D-alanine ligase [Muricauda sp. SYSU M84420]
MGSLKLIWHRITHWEYWPFWMIYYPMFPVWLFFSIKARSIFFFNAANPGMKNGGMAMVSKMDIYNMIPDQFIPKTLFIGKDGVAKSVLGHVLSTGIDFPFIAKPDIGMKAFGVEKIHDKDEFQNYARWSPSHFLVQELIPYQKEVGIFYVSKPGEKQGKITGIVSKEFLSITGDGTSTMVQLIKKNPRSHLQLKVLEQKFGDRLQQILDLGEEFVLVPYGSHTRGAKFVDISHKINDDLVQTIDKVCSQMNGFHYGRLDVLYNSFEELCQGKNFSIIEVNGAGGEATHIYDPKHSLLWAWREVARHWGMLCEISILNKRAGHSYLSFKDGRAMLKQTGALQAQLKF